MENFYFFWDGPLSNFAIIEKIKYKDFLWHSSEQIFMYEKAMFFSDLEIANKIKQSSHPIEAKRLGREVRGFDEGRWKIVREEKMLDALDAKFKVPVYKKILLSTTGATLVEASPYDRIWGIGFREDKALQNRNKWGLNLLGKNLMSVRIQILKETDFYG